MKRRLRKKLWKGEFAWQTTEEDGSIRFMTKAERLACQQRFAEMGMPIWGYGTV